MKVTIFTCSHNHGCYLEQCIRSVLSQTHIDFEYLLYSDVPVDDTTEIMQKFAKQDSRIKVFHPQLHSKINISRLVNQSIKDMTTDYWVWAPADDYFLPELIEKKLEWSNIFKGIYPNAVIYDDACIIRECESFKIQHDCKFPPYAPREFSEAVWKGISIGFTGILIPKSVFEIVGGFDVDVLWSDDFEWMVRAAGIHKIPFLHLPEVLHVKRKNEKSTSSNRLVKKIRANVPKIIKKLRSQL